MDANLDALADGERHPLESYEILIPPPALALRR